MTLMGLCCYFVVIWEIKLSKTLLLYSSVFRKQELTISGLQEL